MNEDLNIYQRIAKIRELCPAVRKSKAGHGYNYVPLEEIQASITAGTKKYGLTIYPTVIPGSAKVTPYSYTRTKIDKQGIKTETEVNEFLYTADTLWHCVNIDKPEEHIEIPWFAAANMADASQTVNSANTYQARGFLSAFFQMAMTEVDPEAYRSKQRAAEEAEGRIILQGIIDTVGSVIQAGLANSPEKRENVAEAIKKYVNVGGKPSDDFRKIKSPEVGAALIADLRALFGLN